MVDTLKDFDLLLNRKEDMAFVSSILVRLTLLQGAISLQHDDLELKLLERQITDGNISNGWMTHTDFDIWVVF